MADDTSAGQAGLWCMHIAGPDDVYPAPDQQTAWMWADRMNGWFSRRLAGTDFKAEAQAWPWSAESHAAGLDKAIREGTSPAVIAHLAATPPQSADAGLRTAIARYQATNHEYQQGPCDRTLTARTQAKIDLLEAALSTPAASVHGGGWMWQPIDTAPKGGVSVLLSVDGMTGIGWFSDRDREWRGHMFEDTDEWSVVQPQAWMPAPQPLPWGVLQVTEPIPPPAADTPAQGGEEPTHDQ